MGILHNLLEAPLTSCLWYSYKYFFNLYLNDGANLSIHEFRFINLYSARVFPALPEYKHGRNPLVHIINIPNVQFQRKQWGHWVSICWVLGHVLDLTTLAITLLVCNINLTFGVINMSSFNWIFFLYFK